MVEENKEEDELYTYVRSFEDEIVYKIIILGDPAVGKTSLVKSYIEPEHFEERYLPTIGVAISKKELEVDGKKITLMLWDIAGQPQFYLLHKVYYNGANAAVLACDLTRAHTLMNLKKWHKELSKYGLRDIPMMMVGNKKDLSQKMIIRPQIEHQAEQLGIGAENVMLTSAKTNENVEDMIQKLTALMLGKKS